jgi:hypothetical protein
MLPDDITAMVRAACTEVADGASVEATEDGQGLQATFRLSFEEDDGGDQDFPVTFGVDAPDYENGINPQYLVISWWIPSQGILMSDDPMKDVALLPALNELNSEPGIKCRLYLDDNREDRNDAIVVETDLPLRRIDQRTVVQCLDRTLDFLSYHAPQLRRHLIASLGGLTDAP